MVRGTVSVHTPSRGTQTIEALRRTSWWYSKGDLQMMCCVVGYAMNGLFESLLLMGAGCGSGALHATMSWVWQWGAACYNELGVAVGRCMLQ
jgi:hypothetical protein